MPLHYGDSAGPEDNRTDQPATKKLLIDGKLVATPRTFPTLNPATGQVYGYAPDAGPAEARAAVAAARRSFDTTEWSTDVAFRAHCLDQLHRALVGNLDELRASTIAEVGATHALTSANQLETPIEIPRYYAEVLRNYSFTEEYGDVALFGQQHRRWVEKEAAGVVAAIVAYNFPHQLALAKLSPALAAGCTVVLKGAPDTPLATLALGEIIAEHTDIPAGVVNVLTSADVEVGKLMTTHPDVDVVSFTGSSAVGRQIMSAAGDTLKRVFLELGGKSAMVLLDDADFALAAMYCAFTACNHAGQGCAITTRLLVPRERHDEIVGMVEANFANITYGDPADPANYMGPLISARQRDKVHGLVERAVRDGARLVCGGEKIDPGFFYAPTLLAGVDPSSEIAQEEVFGPVLAVIPFEDDEDAVRIANHSAYGLSGAVYSADEQRALRVARRIRTGTLSINGGNYFHVDVPFGGYKQSGIGREMGIAGMEEFLETKTLATVVR
ncbi:aldehyde dehydrogenase family protein [Nocardia salmonicida]|uniref:aldehyde dehydrogenase family protein n=1 Tax=Nocardia salmonicida TaxID=53431 RepID=UPI0037AB2245